LDHGGSWKLMHHMARRFYAPILVTARKAGDEFIVSALHDLPLPVEMEIEILKVSTRGTIELIYKQTHALSGDGQNILRIDSRSFDQEGLLFVQWVDERGEKQRTHATSVAYKHLSLPNPALKSVVTEHAGMLSIAISAMQMALYVALECDVSGYFSSNAFDLLAGESTTLTFTPDNPDDLARAKDTLVIRDLYSSSH
jgi:beta-mannosidase